MDNTLNFYHIYTANNWGILFSWKVSVPPSGAGLVLDIYCQRLGYIVQMEGVCAPFGRGVGECACFKIYICIVYICCQQKGTKASWKYIYTYISVVGPNLPHIFFLGADLPGPDLPGPNSPHHNFPGAQLAGPQVAGAHFATPKFSRGPICRLWIFP